MPCLPSKSKSWLLPASDLFSVWNGSLTIALSDLPRANRVKAPWCSLLGHVCCIIHAGMKNTVKPCFLPPGRLQYQPPTYITACQCLPVLSNSWRLLDQDAFILPQLWLSLQNTVCPRQSTAFALCHSVKEKESIAAKAEELRVIAIAEKTQVHV